MAIVRSAGDVLALGVEKKKHKRKNFSPEFYSKSKALGLIVHFLVELTQLLHRVN